jgi:hypothetical protein
VPRPTGRKQQWLSANVGLVLPSDAQPLKLTLAIPRQYLQEHAESKGIHAGWAVMAGLLIASDPRARPRKRGLEVSVRLDRLASQIPAELLNPVSLDPSSLRTVMDKALLLGMSDDPESQRRGLQFLAAHFFANGFPPFRIVMNHADLPRLHAVLQSHPRRFFVQLELKGVGPLVRQAAAQPRGRQRRSAGQATTIGFLACLAYEFVQQGGPLVQAVRAQARVAGYGKRKAISKLELIEFLVERAVSKNFKWSLGQSPPDYREFSRTYLYPYRSRFVDLAKKALAVPGLCERLLALDPTPPAKIRS